MKHEILFHKRNRKVQLSPKQNLTSKFSIIIICWFFCFIKIFLHGCSLFSYDVFIAKFYACTFELFFLLQQLFSCHVSQYAIASRATVWPKTFIRLGYLNYKKIVAVSLSEDGHVTAIWCNSLLFHIFMFPVIIHITGCCKIFTKQWFIIIVWWFTD